MRIAFRRWPWAGGRWKPVAQPQPFSTRPMRWPWPPLLPAGLALAELPIWSRPHLAGLSAEMPRRNPKTSMKRSPLTVWQDRWRMNFCPK